MSRKYELLNKKDSLQLIQQMLPYEESADFNELLDDLQDKYLKKANTENVDRSDYLVEQFSNQVHSAGLNAVIRGVRPQDAQKQCSFVLKLFNRAMAKRYNHIDIVVHHHDNLFGRPVAYETCDYKFKYIGDNTFDDGSPMDFTIGQNYRIIEMQNSFYDRHSIGYFMTTDDYDGQDSDYAHFFGIEMFNDHFILNKKVANDA